MKDGPFPAKPEPGPVASAMMVAIRGYQLTLSYFFGRTCRHLPTCSSYAMEAISRHGAWVGFWLGLFRVARCNPWGTSGFDPVPEQVDAAGWKFWRYARLTKQPENGQ